MIVAMIKLPSCSWLCYFHDNHKKVAMHVELKIPIVHSS